MWAKVLKATGAVAEESAAGKGGWDLITCKIRHGTDAEGHCWWEQGDPTLYTEENEAKRQSLRHHPEVKQALEKWWETAMSTVEADGRAKEEVMRKEDYITVSKCMYKALIETYDEAEALAEAEEDWEKDSQGTGALGKKLFLDAMFELADMWTETIAAEEYRDFLNQLFHCVAEQRPNGTFVWKVRAPRVLNLLGYGSHRALLVHCVGASVSPSNQLIQPTLLCGRRRQ